MVDHHQNKDEALRARSIGARALEEGDKDKAIRFLEKSIKMYRTSEAEALLQRAKNSSNGSGAPSETGGLRHRTKASTPVSTPAASTTPPPDSRPYTKEQADAVKKVIACKDLYEMLGVAKNADDATIKKAYRKKALKFHPDKNSAPGADEAFKEINRAFSVLSDAEKRSQYDQFGETSENPAAQYRRQYYQNDIDPADIFREVFGAGFHPMGGGVRMHFGGMPGFFPQQRHTRHQQQQHDHHFQPSLMNIIPLILFLLISLGSFYQETTKPQLYSLVPDHNYNVEMLTVNRPFGIPDIPYYVKSDFRQKQGRDARVMFEVEKAVVQQHYRSIESRCRALKRGAKGQENFHKIPRKKCIGQEMNNVEHTMKSFSTLKNFCMDYVMHRPTMFAGFLVSIRDGQGYCEVFQKCKEIDDGPEKSELYLSACDEMRRLQQYLR